MSGYQTFLVGMWAFGLSTNSTSPELRVLVITGLASDGVHHPEADWTILNPQGTP